MTRRPRGATGGARVLVLALVLLAAGCAAMERASEEWRIARRDASGQAPDPATTAEAVIQVYGARAVAWRGVFALHTWIVLKPAGAPGYTRYEVVGWGVDRGLEAVRVNRAGPDNYWFGARPELLLDRRGADVEPLIPRVEAAVAAYPYRDSYRTWPGPNSNTFVAHIGRAVPELRLDLPPTAIGKDWIPNGIPIGPTPSGTGLQVSLLGALGILAGVEEGLEVNVLGLSFGVDVKEPALRLPFVGRVGAAAR
ncbi:MAG TPA: DUF3750 domain-containing protein [Candidatus Tectomicrobia bacterium]|nr:DUF3750 domain-containing protein [Candidatus Tectomicrobia bacterium]